MPNVVLRFFLRSVELCATYIFIRIAQYTNKYERAQQCIVNEAVDSVWKILILKYLCHLQYKVNKKDFATLQSKLLSVDEVTPPKQKLVKVSTNPETNRDCCK